MSAKKWSGTGVMPSPVMRSIIEYQKNLPEAGTSEEHSSVGKKDAVYIGCVDARLNPITDLGLPEDTEVIRIISSAIPAPGAKGGDLSVEIANALAEGRTHFIVSAHTACGGLDACLNHPEVGQALQSLGDHLTTLSDAKKAVKDIPSDKRMEAFENATIRSNITNLLKYPGMQEALDAGKITIDGWRIDTHARNFEVVEQFPENGPPILTPEGNVPHGNALYKVATHKTPTFAEGENPNEHNPQMLVLTNTEGEIDIAKWGGKYGKALVYRGENPSDTSLTRVNAVIEFAVDAKKVTDVVLMLPSGQEEKVREGIRNLKNNNKTIQTALDEGRISLHGWTVEPNSHKISAMNLETEEFKPLAEKSVPLPNL